MFGSLIHSVSRNPSLSKQLFGYAILGFALSEAMALFALLVAFLILFGLIGFVGCSAFNAGGLTRCWVGSSVLERGSAIDLCGPSRVASHHATEGFGHLGPRLHWLHSRGTSRWSRVHRAPKVVTRSVLANRYCGRYWHLDAIEIGMLGRSRCQ